MSDKLYVSVLSFKCNTLSEAGEALQGYLDLGLDPVLTNADILITAAEYAETLLKPTNYIDVLSIYESDGREVRGWYLEMERRTDDVIQGKLTGRGIGCLRFVKNCNDSKFWSSGTILATDQRCREIILRMSNRLGISL